VVTRVAFGAIRSSHSGKIIYASGEFSDIVKNQGVSVYAEGEILVL